MLQQVWRGLLLSAIGLTACAVDSEGVMSTPDASRTTTADGAAGHNRADAGGTTSEIDAAIEGDSGVPGQPPGAEGGTVDARAGASDARAGRDAGPALYDAKIAASDASTSHPETCAELNLAAGQKTVTLYAGGDPSKPWIATCVTTASGSRTYLPLPSGNSSSYPLGACATAVPGNQSGVVTTWSAVQFDPTTMTVDTSDQTFASSVGATHETSGNGSFTHQYTSMPFASARSCSTQTAATGTINLQGTSFVVDASQTFPVQGADTGGGAMTSGGITTLSVTGYPAGISPCSTDYYTETGGACLKLTYSP